MVNEPSVFELSRFDCSVVLKTVGWIANCVVLKTAVCVANSVVLKSARRIANSAVLKVLDE